MDASAWQIKKQMCDIGHRIWLRGYCAGNEGNHSARISADRVLCTPTGISKGFLSPQDICIVDMDGTQVEPNTHGLQRTSEILMHLGIYKHRPDVGAVVHSHPPHATAFAMANIALPEGIHPEAEAFLGRVPITEFAMPSTQELPDSIVAKIAPETNSVLMGNHGTVSFSKDTTDAYYKLEILDNYCRILLLCHQLGRVNVLNSQQMAGLMDVKRKFGLDDERFACAADGCIGEDNDQFLATFDNVRPTTATCDCNGGPVQTQTAHDDSSSVDAQQPNVSDDQFQSLVSAITDQMMNSG